MKRFLCLFLALTLLLGLFASPALAFDESEEQILDEGTPLDEAPPVPEQGADSPALTGPDLFAAPWFALGCLLFALGFVTVFMMEAAL